MATPFPGKTYRFQCFSTSKRLNLYSSGTASDGMNVVLYDPDNTREQQWLYSNGRLYIKTNTAFCLDRFTGSAAPDNADIYTASSADANEQLIVFEEVAGYTNCVKIRLTNKVNGQYYYLTAYNTQNGTGSGKSKTSAGNVYWTTVLSSNLQKWTFSEVISNNPYAKLGWRYIFRTSSGTDDNSTARGNYCYDPAGIVAPNYHKHMGIDVICAEGTKLYSPAAGTVIECGGSNSDSRGYFVVLEMDQKDPVTKKTMYIRYLHMKNLPPVSKNQKVTAATLLGYVGNTGRSDTAHLHLDITTMPLSSNPWFGDNQTAENTINPVNFFPNANFPSHYYAVDYDG